MIPTLKPIVWAAIVVALLLGLWLGYRALTADSRTEARLARNQAESALESGRDAVDTVGKASDREAASDALTRDNDRSIRDAEGADDEVGSAVNDAGLRSLCRRRAYRSDPRCVQFANP